MDIEMILKPAATTESYLADLMADKASGEPDWLRRKRIRHLYHGRP